MGRSYENWRKKGESKLTVEAAEIRKTLLLDYWRDFKENHNLILKLKAKDKSYERHDYFKNDYFDLGEEAFANNSAHFAEFINSRGRRIESEGENHHEASHQQLPRISLPRFGGNLTEWRNFKDLFVAIIINRKQLKNVERLHYLKTCLFDEPYQLIQNISITEENFERAWKILVDRYENKRILIHAHLSKLLSIKSATKESAPELKRIYNSVNENVEALKALNCPTEHWDVLLQFIVLQRLDAQSRKDWETSPSVETSGFAELKVFLQKRIRALESYSGSSIPLATKIGTTKVHSVITKLNSNKQTPSCSLCQKKHFIAYCSDFHAKKLEDRKALIKQKDLCQNCLGNHPLKDCLSSKTCRVCGLKHHTSLHEPESSVNNAISSSNQIGIGSSKILGTAKIIVRGSRGENVSIRALIDSGSEVSLISESVVQLLRLPKKSANLSIQGVGPSSSITTRHSVQLTFFSRWSPQQAYSIDAFVLPKITAYLPAKSINNIEWLGGTRLPLADDDLSSSQPVSVLLGADIYPQIIEQGLQKSPSGNIVAQNTTLGWIIIGELDQTKLKSQVQILQCSTDDQLMQQIQRFWEQEEVSRPLSNFSPQDLECETHYKNTHRRLEDGSYMVRLPFKSDAPSLGTSLSQAKSMLQRLENRFQKDKEFHSLYVNFLREYVLLDHMQLMNEKETPLYILPHHGVYRASSSTTKLRVVFNASAKSSSGYALNDLLHTGPQLLPYLDDLLIRWRKHRVCFSADIEKMFRCIRLHHDDQPYQVILWRENPSQPIQFYKLKTVTYGMSCSPYLASRTLHQLADDEQTTFPIASNILKTDTYVDDILSGADTLEEGLKAQAELLNLLKKAKFNLRKWTSNHVELLEHLPPELVESSLNWQSSEFSILGLHWDHRDTFHWRPDIKPEEELLEVTKRTVLRKIAQLFDPLGFFAPAIITAKIFMQSLWLSGLDWDDPLTSEDSSKWKSFYNSLSSLSAKRIPRWIGFTTTSVCQLHAFADASTRAYGAVVYLRSQSNDGLTTSLIAAKTTVAPIKLVSLPRLELCAAQLAAQLTAKITDALKIQNLTTFLWSDSTIVLSWIHSHPGRWKTYVANRVSTIQNLLPGAKWRYVPTIENPADLASRGITPEALIDHELWWSGPPWLRDDCKNWPAQPPTLKVQIEERSPAVTVHQIITSDSDLIKRYSNLRRLLRISAWCLRFYAKTRKLKKLSSPEDLAITAADIEDIKRRLILSVQSTFFNGELILLRQNKPVLKSSPLAKLNPFLDEESVLRVGGRLKNSLLNFRQKHPIILPRQSRFTELVIQDVHARTLHGGLQLTLATVRSEYWIINGRNAVKAIIHRCNTCIRFRGSRLYQQMGDLPKERVQPSRPFAHTGVDYCGPMIIKSHKGRKAPTSKGYVCIFVCFSVKAVHLELVSDYTTDSFLAAYKRFVARRGVCPTITSDRGTNFIGAATELKTLLEQFKDQNSKVQRYLIDHGTTWKFNPGNAPHFGGLWETTVKSVKHHLKRVTGETHLTYEELSTLLTQIEGILNSRPLFPLSDDPEDLNILTPNHFLIGPNLNLVPEPSLDHLPTSRLSKWQFIQHCRDAFWKQWSNECLQHLQQRNKWRVPNRNLRVGDLVLVQNDQTPPARWPLARVVDLHPGSDGLVRVATIKTASSQFKRPIVRLVLLHSEDDREPEKNSNSTVDL